MDFANLHLHSHWSDGLLPAGELISLASPTPGLQLIALTDHDSLSGLEPFFRAWRAHRSRGVPVPEVAAGVELSTYDPVHDLGLHVLGYFPWVAPSAPEAGLARLAQSLGPVCRRLTEQRGEYDLERRVRKAHALDLDGLARAFPKVDAALAAFRAASRLRITRAAELEPKTGDLCQGAPPATYQDLIDAWPELVPPSSRERVTLYTLRTDSSRVARLARLYMEQDGLPPHQAVAMAEKRQGCLAAGLGKPDYRPTPRQGLELLKRAGAVTVLAHPAVDHLKVGFAEFDRIALMPLLEAGLEGIEVYYPYDPAYREEAWRYYRAKVAELGLLTGGGTDFHGDGRTGWAEAPLPMAQARSLLASAA